MLAPSCLCSKTGCILVGEQYLQLCVDCVEKLVVCQGHVIFLCWRHNCHVGQMGKADGTAVVSNVPTNIPFDGTG